jgi:hypothetical protein
LIPEDANTVKNKRIWIDASKELCLSNEFNATGPKSEWVGHVSNVRMRDNGSLVLAVDIKDGNKVRDLDVDKKFVSLVEDLKAGSLFTKGKSVRFSGKFSKGDTDENECLDAGLDSNPELDGETFSFTFTKIERN